MVESLNAVRPMTMRRKEVAVMVVRWEGGLEKATTATRKTKAAKVA